MWDVDMDIHAVRTIRMHATAFLGVGAVERLGDVARALAARGVRSVLGVAEGRSKARDEVWDAVCSACRASGLRIARYDRVAADPSVDDVDAAAALGAQSGAAAVVAVGGDAALNVAKGAAVLLAGPGRTARELFAAGDVSGAAAPIVAVALAPGSGGAANRFAVAEIPERKCMAAVSGEGLYPLFTVHDPSLMTGPPRKRTLAAALDALSHAVEAATSTAANSLSALFAGEAVRLVAAYLPRALENSDDLRAFYGLSVAALAAGAAVDNGLLHLPHALGYPLVMLKPGLAHGLDSAMLLPAVTRACYPARAELLAQLLAPLVPGLSGRSDEADAAARGLQAWLAGVGAGRNLHDAGFTGRDVSRLCDLVETTPLSARLLALAPLPADRDRAAALYRESLQRATGAARG